MLDEPLEVIWTVPAYLALEKARQYIAVENAAAAEDLIDKIHERICQLSMLPDLGFKSRVRRIHGEIRELVVERYRILYRHDPELKRILVLLVWHASRRNPTAKDFEQG